MFDGACSKCKRIVGDNVVKEGDKFLCCQCAESRLNDLKSQLVDKYRDATGGVWPCSICGRSVSPVCFRCVECTKENEQAYFEALKNLVDKLDLVHENDEYKKVWSWYHSHSGPYVGPQYEHELDKARALVKKEKTNG